MNLPSPSILSVPPLQPAREYYTGESIATDLTNLGLPCTFVAVVLAPQIATYHFDLFDPTDTTKLKRAVAALSAVAHEPLTYYTPSERAHFAIEWPLEKQTVYLRDVLYEDVIRSEQRRSPLFLPLGTDTGGKPLGLELPRMPHVLLAGATGSGKSVLLNVMLTGLLFSARPSDCQLVLIDPKRVELSPYEGLRHLARPVVKDHTAAIRCLSGLCRFMDDRYRLMASKGVKEASAAGLPSVVVVIDELADLMLTSRFEAEESIVRLAQLGRAAGIHLIIATQRPTANVITGLIKSNIPCRIALQTASIRDSLNILDHKGAEALTGRGDALLKLPDKVREIRFQSAYVGSTDIERAVSFWKK